MKTLKTLLLAIAIIASYSITAQVAVTTDGTSADGSAMLEVKSTDKGFLPPRMTSSEVNAISTPAEGLIVYDTDLNKPVYHDGTEWKGFNGATAYLQVGDFFEGGVIFYIFQSGDPGYVAGETHGLVCTVSDQSTGAGWGCWNTELTGADGSAIGTGAKNTIDIEAGCTTNGIAADICANLSLNGYNDWFLPSKDELYAMYLNKATINATAGANGGSSFVSDYYWSSTEYSSSLALLQHFSFDFQSEHDKNFTNRVRAVRAF